LQLPYRLREVNPETLQRDTPGSRPDYSQSQQQVLRRDVCVMPGRSLLPSGRKRFQGAVGEARKRDLKERKYG
jgi:hypothetical protein